MKSSKTAIQTSTLACNSGLSRREMLKGVAGLGAAAALSRCAPINKKSGGATKASKKRATSDKHSPLSAAAQSQALAERAEDYLQQIFEVARGPGGLIISHSRFDTR